MTVIPVSMLSRLDLSILGNNLLPQQRPARRVSMAAVNRSLAIHDSQVERLYASRRERQGSKAA